MWGGSSEGQGGMGVRQRNENLSGIKASPVLLLVPTGREGHLGKRAQGWEPELLGSIRGPSPGPS